MNSSKSNPAHKDGSNNSKMEGSTKNYRNPDPLNCGLEGRIMTVSMVNGKVESGKCTRMGQFFMEMVMGNGKPIIIAKSAVVTVSIL
jgi:hypothetical protein